MLLDLLGNELSVVLIPAPDIRHGGHCVRAAESINCFWYRKFCGQFPPNGKKKNTLLNFD
jgi:hypothetical protein